MTSAEAKLVKELTDKFDWFIDEITGRKWSGLNRRKVSECPKKTFSFVQYLIISIVELFFAVLKYPNSTQNAPKPIIDTRNDVYDDRMI